MWIFYLLLAQRSNRDVWLSVAVVSEATVSLWCQRHIPGIEEAWVRQYFSLMLSGLKPVEPSPIILDQRISYWELPFKPSSQVLPQILQVTRYLFNFT